MSDECAMGFCYRGAAPNSKFCDRHKETEALRAAVATLTSERDAARREMDEALANARDCERDADIAEAQLSVVTAERDRLKGALFPFAYLTGAKLDCGDCGRTVPNCDRRDELRTPKDTVCRGPIARRALTAPPTPPVGTPVPRPNPDLWCAKPRSEARKLGAFAYHFQDGDDGDEPYVYCTPACAQSGRHATPAVQGEPPRCKSWSGRGSGYVDGDGFMLHRGDGTETCFCTPACCAAERPLHPREGEPPRANAVPDLGFICWDADCKLNHPHEDPAREGEPR